MKTRIDNLASLSPARAQTFLKEFANVRDDSLERLTSRFSDCLLPLSADETADSTNVGTNEGETAAILFARTTPFHFVMARDEDAGVCAIPSPKEGPRVGVSASELQRGPLYNPPSVAQSVRAGVDLFPQVGGLGSLL